MSARLRSRRMLARHVPSRRQLCSCRGCCRLVFIFAYLVPLYFVARAKYYHWQEPRSWDHLVQKGASPEDWAATVKSDRHSSDLPVPVVIFGGVRQAYLGGLLRSLDESTVAGNHGAGGDGIHARPVIISFNKFSQDGDLGPSFDAAARSVSAKHLLTFPVRTQPLVDGQMYGTSWFGHEFILQSGKLLGFGSKPANYVYGKNKLKKGHRYVKHVWMETMKAVWDLLEGYDGDVCFLEDDLVVAPDFFRALQEVSRVKREQDLQVFSMGGWGGENTADPQIDTLLRKTTRYFPTMGYGFNRSLWRHIENASTAIMRSVQGRLEHVAEENDWSVAVVNALRGASGWSGTPEAKLALRSFNAYAALEIVQPTVSRVHHVGSVSSIGVLSHGAQHVKSAAPWLQFHGSGSSGAFTLKPGLRSYYGQMCSTGLQEDNITLNGENWNGCETTSEALVRRYNFSEAERAKSLQLTDHDWTFEGTPYRFQQNGLV